MNQYFISDTIPPKQWTESIPIGCGRMGATVMCGVGCEILNLNEEGIWSENTDHNTDPEMFEKLQAVRDLLLSGRPAEADVLAKNTLGNCFSRIRSFEGAGKLLVTLHSSNACKHYRHTLDLTRGLATVEYDKDGSHYQREYFASYPDNIIACRFTSSKKPIQARIGYDRERILSEICQKDEICIVSKTAFGDHRFCVKIRVVSDGEINADGGDLVVKNASNVCIYVSIRSEALFGAEAMMHPLFPLDLDFDALKARHIADFSKMMSRADIELPTDEVCNSLPMHDRLSVYQVNKPKDHSLFSLLWQFGRYLLISSGRPGTLPANLQGIWTDGDVSPWNSDYHTNINLQMNYWPAEIANLSECHLSLFDYMNRYLLPAGQRTAQEVYHANGCVVHHLSDIYGYTNPADGFWGLWPHGASWLALHMWEHYLFHPDKAFLRNVAYPFIREASIFFLETLVEDKEGRLLYAPSTSPENQYLVNCEHGNTHQCFLAASTAMDIEIIFTLLDCFIKSSELLAIEDKTVALARSSIAKLPPLQIGSDGRLLEWLEEYEETEPGHRHISHSFGLYPGMMITRETPDRYRAIEKTIAHRLSAPRGGAIGSAHNVGWSLVWLAASYARLHKGERAFAMLDSFSKQCISRHLWDLYPLGATPAFQIDANLGYTAALAEMLIQSHEGVISLLPALPVGWDHGHFHGLRARGGYELAVEWEKHQVRSIEIHATVSGECKIELPPSQKTTVFKDQNGTPYTAQNGILTLWMQETLQLHI